MAPMNVFGLIPAYAMDNIPPRETPPMASMLIHVRPIAQMVDDGINILNGPFETGDRNFNVAGKAGAVWSKPLTISSA